MLKSKFLPMVGATALLVTGLVAAAPVEADTFTFTSCHISGSACEGGTVPSGFGTVTLTQSGTSVNFDVVLNGSGPPTGNRFVETGAGGGALFAFNDTLSGTAVTNISATLNGAAVTNPGGPLGVNQPNAVHGRRHRVFSPPRSFARPHLTAMVAPLRP